MQSYIQRGHLDDATMEFREDKLIGMVEFKQ